jgi:NAD(P)-dependent dehydrogenase (short-subunit alcohol dehydrogenase family)
MAPRPGRVAGKAALITGAAGGLGQAMARMLVKEGAKVAVSDIDLNGARALADSINADHPGQAFAYEHDVTFEDDWVRVVGAAAEDMGGLSILVNNAGIGGQLVWAEQDTLENWRKVQAINLESVMLGCKHALPHLRASGAGSIVNISSIAGLGRLQRHQGGGLALHQDGGAGVRQGRLERPRQLGAPGLHPDADPRPLRRHGRRGRDDGARKAGAGHPLEAHRRAG